MLRLLSAWPQKELTSLTYSKGAEAAASVVEGIEHDGGKALAIQADAADVEAVEGRGRKDRRDFRAT